MTQQQKISRAEAQPPFFVGLDLGGTNIKVGVVDDLGRTLYFETNATEVEQGPEAGARRMGEAIRRAIAGAGLDPREVAGVGLGSPGTMDIPAGRLVDPANLPGWQNFPIRDKVSQYAGFPVTFANDARAAPIGARWGGLGNDRNDRNRRIMLEQGASSL
jgi:glucokinase